MMMILRRRVIGIFLTGVFAILPLIITVLIVIWVARAAHRLLGPQTMVGQTLSHLGLQVAQDSPGWLSYGFGIAVALGVVFTVGLILELGAKRMVHEMLDNAFNRIPAIGKVYRTARDLVVMFDQDERADIKAMSPVFCEFGDQDPTGVLGFLVSPEKYQVSGNDYYIVMVPSAPVPFGGALLFIPVHRLKRVDFSTEGLMSIYMSLGATAPQYVKRTAPSASPDTPAQPPA